MAPSYYFVTKLIESISFVVAARFAREIRAIGSLAGEAQAARAPAALLPAVCNLVALEHVVRACAAEDHCPRTMQQGFHRHDPIRVPRIVIRDLQLWVTRRLMG